jgi:hypothetical protein
MVMFKERFGGCIVVFAEVGPLLRKHRAHIDRLVDYFPDLVEIQPVCENSF